jgi:RNA polymerase sigma-70 factor (ECF subfamily)
MRSVGTDLETTGAADAADDSLDLIRRVANKDKAAFEHLYHRYAARLGRFLSRVVRHHDLIEEAINDTFMTVWQSAGRYDPDMGRLDTWLFGIAHHKALKALTRRSRYNRLIDNEADVADQGDDPHRNGPQDPHTPEATVIGWQIGERLTLALQQLTPEHRAVIELTFFECMSYNEIAAALECPVNTVKTRMYYARKRLAEFLAAMDGSKAGSET